MFAIYKETFLFAQKIVTHFSQFLRTINFFTANIFIIMLFVFKCYLVQPAERNQQIIVVVW